MLRFLFFISVVFLVVGCNENSKPLAEKTNSNAVKYAKHFRFAMEGGEQILVLLDPETGKEEARILKNEIPTKSLKMVVLSSTHIGMMHVLGEEKKIVGVSNMNYVANKQVIQHFKQGKLKEYGEENAIPLENLIASGANVVMYSGFGKEFPHQKQLEKLEINCLANYDWRENHPLGKAEWIKVFGFLLGKEKEANAYFEKVEKEYKDLKKKASRLKKSKSLISGNVIGDLWYAPAGESYNAVLFQDANINYFYANSKGTGSISLSLEQVLKENKSCEFWLNPGTTTLTKLQQMNPKAVFMNSYTKQNVYCYSNEGNRFWEMSAVEPHKVLSDLIQICHPNNGLTNKMYFYSKLEK